MIHGSVLNGCQSWPGALSSFSCSRVSPSLLTKVSSSSPELLEQGMWMRIGRGKKMHCSSQLCGLWALLSKTAVFFAALVATRCLSPSPTQTTFSSSEIRNLCSCWHDDGGSCPDDVSRHRCTQPRPPSRWQTGTLEGAAAHQTLLLESWPLIGSPTPLWWTAVHPHTRIVWREVLVAAQDQNKIASAANVRDRCISNRANSPSFLLCGR